MVSVVLEVSVVTSVRPFVNSFKNRLDTHWASQELRYDWEAELSRTRSRSRVEFWVLPNVISSKQWYGHRSTSLTPITSAILCYVMCSLREVHCQVGVNAKDYGRFAPSSVRPLDVSPQDVLPPWCLGFNWISRIITIICFNKSCQTQL